MASIGVLHYWKDGEVGPRRITQALITGCVPRQLRARMRSRCPPGPPPRTNTRGCTPTRLSHNSIRAASTKHPAYASVACASGCVKVRHLVNQRDLDRHPYRAAASSLSPAADQPRRQSCECCPDNSRHRANRRRSVVPDHLAVARCCDDRGAVDLMASISSLSFRTRARTHLVAACCLRIVACRIMLGLWWNVAVPDRSYFRADLSDICDRRDVRRHSRIERVAFTHPSRLSALGKPADGGPLLCRRHVCR